MPGIPRGRSGRDSITGSTRSISSANRSIQVSSRLVTWASIRSRLLVTGQQPYIVPSGSYITFSTFVDAAGDVVLKQQGVLANPNLVTLFLDEWGGPQAWQQQAANLRRAF